MKTVALFGAGQIGAMVSRLLGTGCGACCFADNSEEKWGGELAGIPIVSPRDALLFDPDAVCICVLDDERAAQMRSQLDALGYDGEILSPALLKTFDARSAQMRLIAEQINALAVPGDVAELGVFRGDFAVQINAAFPAERYICLTPPRAFAPPMLISKGKTATPQRASATFRKRQRTLWIKSSCTENVRFSTRAFFRPHSADAKNGALPSSRSMPISMRRRPRLCRCSGSGFLRAER